MWSKASTVMTEVPRSVPGSTRVIIQQGLFKRREVIFPHQKTMWNFSGKHKIHQQFLTESTWAKLQRKGESSGHGPRTSVLMIINDLDLQSLFTKLRLAITLLV